MSGDVRAAAERLARCADECEGNLCRNYCCSWPGRCQEDAIALAAAYLAEHPADDAEPVRAEWLKAVGFILSGSASGIEHWRLEMPHQHGFIWWYAEAVAFTSDLHDWKVHREVLLPGDFPTSGHVRRLLAALGVPLSGREVA